MLKNHSAQLKYTVVMHTDIKRPTIKKGDYQEIQGLSDFAISNITKRVVYFVNRFSCALYGKKSRRKNAFYKPIIISTIEGTKPQMETHTGDDSTCHINLALGNIPDGIDLRATIEDCWLKAGGMNIRHNRRKPKSLNIKQLYVEPIRNVNGLLTYITKEGISSWMPECTMWS